MYRLSSNKFSIGINHIYIIAAVLLSATFWCILKYYYPYPNLTFDSYYYIEAAVANSDVSTWPIGYSKFIRLVSFFTHSGNVLVTVQYIIMQLSLLFFFITLRRFLKAKELFFILIFIFLFCCPLFLYASNHIMSDILFTGLSILWVSQLIWILYKPNPFLLLTHAILLLLIFSIRYSALYYPLIAGIVILRSKQSWKVRLMGIALMLILLGGFIQFTSNRMETVTGSRQFSYTGGWKQANNALYMYEHEFNLDNVSAPDKFKVIDSISRAYFSAPHAQVDLLEHMDVTQGTWYTSFSPSPLRQYMKVSKGIDPATSDFKKLAYFGPFYNAYGNYLIKKYPVAFTKYVIVPNIITYFFPISEIYDTDNLAFTLMDTEFSRIAQKWFNLSTISVPNNLIEIRATILAPYGFIFTFIHILFAFAICSFIFLKVYKRVNDRERKTIFLFISICILNFLFIILVAPSVLRFQLTVFILEFISVLLILNVFTLFDDKTIVK